MDLYHTKKTYRTPEGLEGYILQVSAVFPHLRLVVLKYGEFDWRVRYININDLILMGDSDD
jgi:hypothetical protein